MPLTKEARDLHKQSYYYSRKNAKVSLGAGTKIEYFFWGVCQLTVWQRFILWINTFWEIWLQQCHLWDLGWTVPFVPNAAHSLFWSTDWLVQTIAPSKINLEEKSCNVVACSFNHFREIDANLKIPLPWANDYYLTLCIFKVHFSNNQIFM